MINDFTKKVTSGNYDLLRSKEKIEELEMKNRLIED